MHYYAITQFLAVAMARSSAVSKAFVVDDNVRVFEVFPVKSAKPLMSTNAEARVSGAADRLKLTQIPTIVPVIVVRELLFENALVKLAKSEKSAVPSISMVVKLDAPRAKLSKLRLYVVPGILIFVNAAPVAPVPI